MPRRPTQVVFPGPGHVVEHLQEMAKKSDVRWTQHAMERMRERDITLTQALVALRSGVAKADPEVNEQGEWQVTLGKRCAGQRVRVVATLSGTEVSVLTVMD